MQEPQRTSRKRKASAEVGPGNKFKKRRRRGGGGAWRAFIHVQSAGHKLSDDDTKRVSDMYWNLDDQEFQHYKSMGDSAQQLHNQGLPSFPMHSRRQRFQRGRDRTSTCLPAHFSLLSEEERIEAINQVLGGHAAEAPKLGGAASWKKELEVSMQGFASIYLKKQAVCRRP